MATEKKKKTEETKSAPSQAQAVQSPSQKSTASKGSMAKYAIAIIIIVVIIGVAIFAGGFLSGGQSGGTSGNFNTFKQNFNSAPRVAIYVTDYNGTILSGTVGCATAIIEQVVGSKTDHRNASTIDYNIVNQTSCIKAEGLGGKTANYTNTTVQNCMNYTKSEPTIFINYSSTNVTIIKPDSLYIAGTLVYLRECGVASELS